ncbi:DUF4157 domain-containing protein [Ascidiimonas sp. W6]|uniref:eCIS core domain-containing protein n=1 Tax=Ascidiimonas meishanensis TaxID=3128903 RepID=UPI0030ED93DF
MKSSPEKISNKNAPSTLVSNAKTEASGIQLFSEKRQEHTSFQKLQAAANDSKRVKQLAATQKSANEFTNQHKLTLQRKANNTGMPDNLKSGIENLSGLAMDDVKVHYNSPKPAQLQAHAYAQGNQIHLASGQEKHLPHEAWHVVQQKQGRVQPTKQLKATVAINDDEGLEKEADIMGAKALQQVSYQAVSPSNVSSEVESSKTIQGKFLVKNPKSATANMDTAVRLFYNAISAINGELFQLINSSDNIHVIIDPGTAFGVAGSGETKLERRTSDDDAPETFADTLGEIVDKNAVTDDMRTQPLILRIKINQKGLGGLTNGSVAQLAETLAHEYSLHAEAQLAAIKALRNPALSNREALRAIVASSNDHGGFNNAEAQHAELTNESGDRFDSARAVINEMKRNLTRTDAQKLEKAFQDDIKDWH